MKIFITTTFKRSAKKLHQDQTTLLKDSIKKIAVNPFIGEIKTGDLTGVRVHKFNIHHQLILLAYSYKEELKEITLLSFSSHENFYKKPKVQLDSNNSLKNLN